MSSNIEDFKMQDEDGKAATHPDFNSDDQKSLEDLNNKINVMTPN